MLLCSIVGAVAFACAWSAGSALAGTGTRYDWDCGTIPSGTACNGIGGQKVSQVTAVNTANAYRKCAKITRDSNGVVYARVCSTGYSVDAYCDENGLMSYPNSSINMTAAVGVDDGQSHGIRGIAYY